MLTEFELAQAVSWWAEAGYSFKTQPLSLNELFQEVERQHQEILASGYSRAHYAPDDPRFRTMDAAGNSFAAIRSGAK